MMPSNKAKKLWLLSVALCCLIGAYLIYVFKWFEQTDLSIIIASEIHPLEMHLMFGKLPMIPGTAKAYLSFIGKEGYQKKADEAGMNIFSFCGLELSDDEENKRQVKTLSWLLSKEFVDVCEVTKRGENVLVYFESPICNAGSVAKNIIKESFEKNCSRR